MKKRTYAFHSRIAVLILAAGCVFCGTAGAARGFGGAAHTASGHMHAGMTGMGGASPESPVSAEGGTLTAAGSIKGVGTMGYGAPAAGAPPRSSHGASPRDFQRGYEGHHPGGDPWNRDADFKARNYETRYGPQPRMATPPQGRPGAAPVEPGLPPLPKPPLPGDRDMPADSPAPAMR